DHAARVPRQIADTVPVISPAGAGRENPMPRILGLAVAALALTAATVRAHHSYAAFDRDHPVSIEGNISRVLYANPHVVVTVKAADGDYTVEWLSFSQLARTPETKATSLNVGDHVIVTARATKDRSE